MKCASVGECHPAPRTVLRNHAVEWTTLSPSRRGRSRGGSRRRGRCRRITSCQAHSHLGVLPPLDGRPSSVPLVRDRRPAVAAEGLRPQPAGSPRRPTQPSRMRDGCVGSRLGAIALTGEDRSPPPAATAAPVVRRRPRGARARQDTSKSRGLIRRRCRQRRSRRVDRLTCSRARRRCTCRSPTAIHAH